MQPERCQGVWDPVRRACRQAGTCGLVLMLSGCSEVALLQPRGPIGESERFVILVAFALMLIVVIPVVVMSLWFPRRYRADNPQGHYAPTWSESARIDLVIWLIPTIIIVALATLTWRESHRLDPAVPIRSEVTPLEVQVVSLDWKWLFIYPREGVAAVNQLVIPVNTPISFRITSGSVMTSFFIPRLGSQIYAMAGRQSRLHLLADTPGGYAGQNQQLSGVGFSDMHFQVLAVTPRQYQEWLQKTRRSRAALDRAQYRKLSQPGRGYPVTVYSSVAPGLFDNIIDGFRGESGAPAPAYGAGNGY